MDLSRSLGSHTVRSLQGAHASTGTQAQCMTKRGIQSGGRRAEASTKKHGGVWRTESEETRHNTNNRSTSTGGSNDSTEEGGTGLLCNHKIHTEQERAPLWGKESWAGQRPTSPSRLRPICVSPPHSYRPHSSPSSQACRRGTPPRPPPTIQGTHSKD